jgi:hypothetical protein
MPVAGSGFRFIGGMAVANRRHGGTKKPAWFPMPVFLLDGWSFPRSGECLELRLELVLGDAGADDLVLDLAVLEEQQQGNGADVVLHGEVARVIDVDLADLGGCSDFGCDLVDHRANHFAGAAPFGPEVHEDGHVGVDDFGLEIRFVECQSHGGTMERVPRNVKSRSPDRASGSWFEC